MTWMNGDNPAYRLAGKFEMIRQGRGMPPADDQDMADAEKRGLVQWDGSKWVILS